MLDHSENFMESPLPASRLKYSSIGSHESIVSPSFSSPLRFWRPAAQRNIRNQWSKLLSSKNRWVLAASEARDHATKLVNAYLRQRDLPEMTLGDLNDIPGIRERCYDKLADMQDLWRSKLISSYKDMVGAVNGLGKASSSMRCYLKGSASKPIIQFSDQQEDPNDSGIGNGIPVFSFLSISIFEDLARELVNMFTRELSLKRFLLIGLISINGVKEGGEDLLDWTNEIYDGEFDELRFVNMLKQDSCYSVPPQIMDYESSDPLKRATIKSPKHDTLMVYLTSWISDMNIDRHRVEEIFSIVEEEMHTKLL